MKNRPKFVAVSEPMKHIAAMLERELLGWPGVSARPMFGMRALYRGPAIFAMLPETRAMGQANAFAYKLVRGAQEREGKKWQLFAVDDERDLSAALACLDKAYRRAASL